MILFLSPPAATSSTSDVLSTLSFPGILETDITFLVIFSMVFMLSCYFACKYCHGKSRPLSSPLNIGVIKCASVQLYYKIDMFS